MKHNYLARLLAKAALATALILGSLVPILAMPDLDVTYVTRTPRYPRYPNQEIAWANPGDWLTQPYATAQDLEAQRWPKSGDTVTFTAKIRNSGNQPTGSFAYKWYFDGVEVASGTLPSIGSKQTTSVSWQWVWDSEQNDHYVKFVVDPDNAISENIESNNMREDRTNALTYCLLVWQSVYDWFDANITSYHPELGSYEDWVQNQLGYMNQLFEDAIWPTSPDGILERVKLDMVEIIPNGTPNPQGSNHDTNPSAHMYWDAVWGMGPDEYPRIFNDPNEPHPEFLSGPYLWDLHEWSHQLGRIDMYQMDCSSRGNSIMPYGHDVTCPGMMTGNEMQYDPETAAAFNSELHKRRGLFGDYQYDVPETCRVRILDAYGRPIPNATVKFYQDNWDTFAGNANFVGTTDANGSYTMPNRYCWAWDGINERLADDHRNTTLWGHTLHDNPWAQIGLTGHKSVFFCEITSASGTKDYQFLEIIPFNLAFWSGYTESYTYDLQTVLLEQKPATSNLNAVKMTSVDNGFTVGDGGVILKWNGATWSRMTSNTTTKLRAVDSNASTGLTCVVGSIGTILIYTGGTWDKKTVGTNNFNTCAVISPTTIIIGGDDGSLYRSTDSGQTWGSKINATTQSIRSISFCDSLNGIMTCDNGKVYYTTDGGMTWTAGAGVIDQHGATMTCCSMPSPTEAYAANNDGKIFKSSNGGSTWTMIGEGCWIDDWNTMDMRPGGIGWIGGGMREGNDCALLRNFFADKYMWAPVTGFGSQNEIYGVSCVSDDEAWVVGKAGLLFHIETPWQSFEPDETAPVMGLVTAAWDERNNKLHAEWSATDLESGVAEYRYAVGTTPSDPGSGYLLGWTSSGTDLASDISGSIASSGQTIYAYVKARNSSGVWSDAAVSNGQIITFDVTPPIIGTVIDGGDTVNTDILAASWSAIDPESVIVEYQYAIGTTPTDPGSGYIRNWTSTGSLTSISNQLTLTDGVTYYFYIRARNVYDLWSAVAVSDGIMAVKDDTPPVMGPVVDDGTKTVYTTTLHARWSATDPESSIREYQYAIGTSPTDPGSGYTRGWTSTGTETSVIAGGLNLVDLQTYYFYVKAKNSDDLWSSVAVSDGIQVNQGDMTIGQVKYLPVGTSVALKNVVYVGTFNSPAGFYVESPDRSAGIFVSSWGTRFDPGTILDITGTLRVSNGELYINPAGGFITHGTTTIEPLVLTNSAMGGGKMGSQAALKSKRWVVGSSGTPEYKLVPSAGLNNVGLLVKTTGKLTYVDTSGWRIFIDDGSQVSDGSIGLDGEPVKGLCVMLDTAKPATLPPLGTPLAITGVSSSQFKWYGSDNQYTSAVLRPRTSDDINCIDGAIISGSVTKAETTNYVVESPHPYPASYYNQWTITGPTGAQKMRLHMHLQILDGLDTFMYTAPDYSSIKIINNYDGDMWTDWVTGYQVLFSLSTSSTDNYYGFRVDQYQVQSPLPAVTVTLMPGNITVATDAKGCFMFTGLAPGTYTITPSSSGMTFSPASQTITVTSGQLKGGADFSLN